MNRRKKREAQCPDVNPPVAREPESVDDPSKHEYICEGCSRVSKDMECKVYPYVPSYFIRRGCCYFNKPEVKTKKKLTKGQQKQGRSR